MNCPSCGALMSDNARFCTNCGADVTQYGMPMPSQTGQAAAQPTAQQQYGQTQLVNNGYQQHGGGANTARRPIPAQTAMPPQMPTPTPTPVRDDTVKNAAIIALCCALIVGSGVVITSRFMGGRSSSSSSSSANTSTTSSVPKGEGEAIPLDDDNEDDGGQVTGGQGTGTVSNSSDTSSSDTSSSSNEPAVRSSLAEYSWEELAQIGAMISNAGERFEANEIASRYNLLTGGGVVVKGESKTLDLGSLGTVQMRLVDIYHDEAETPSGRAGLTFIASSSPLRHRMAPKSIQEGGWEASEMRSYLQNEVYYALPSEVRSHVVPVRKISNNYGVTSDAGVCTGTWDTLWLPSVMELAGEVDWTYHTHPELGDVYNAIFASEGYQYGLFAYAGIDCWGGNDILVVPQGTYWMRSISPSTARGRYVDTNGDPSMFDDANGERTVCFGFCL